MFLSASACLCLSFFLFFPGCVSMPLGAFGCLVVLLVVIFGHLFGHLLAPLGSRWLPGRTRGLPLIGTTFVAPGDQKWSKVRICCFCENECFLIVKHHILRVWAARAAPNGHFLAPFGTFWSTLASLLLPMATLRPHFDTPVTPLAFLLDFGSQSTCKPGQQWNGKHSGKRMGWV